MQFQSQKGNKIWGDIDESNHKCKNLWFSSL
jgi:hypothetical protein